MKNIKTILISYILPCVAVLMASFTYKENNANHLCKHQYALCTSAVCVPQPGDPTKAICFCDVEDGPSLSTVPCETISPSTNENNIRTIYSTFSMEQYSKGKKGMKCPAGTPWTWCLNKQCTVDPINPNKAICICDVMRTGEWMTLGGNCDTSSCSTGYWSGAELTDLDDGVAFLIKALGINQSPVKWCPSA